MTSNYTWLIADFINPVSGFSADAFAIDDTGFSNDLNDAFGIALGNTVGGDNTQIYLTYTAVTEPGAALVGGIGILPCSAAVATEPQPCIAHSVCERTVRSS